MAINTAFMLLLSGICLLASRLRTAMEQRLYTGISVVLIILPSAILFQHIFNIDLGIDWAGVHAALGDGHAKPGRTAPNACLGFLFAGTVFLLLRNRPVSLLVYRVSITLAILAFGIGITAFLGFVLKLETLYQIASYNKMAAFTAIGITAVGIGLWGLAADLMPLRSNTPANDARQITGLAVALLTVFALATSMVAFGVLKRSYEKSAADNIWHTAKTSASSVSALLTKAILLSKSVSTRPILQISLASLAADPGDTRTKAYLREEARNMLALGFTGIRILDHQNRVIESAGSVMADRTSMSVPISSQEDRSELIWQDGYYLATRHDVIHNGKLVGTLITERRLAQFNEFVQEAQRIAKTSDLSLCARAADEAACFPNRFSRTSQRFAMFKSDGRPAHPASRALLGEMGSVAVKDSRGVDVIAGYVPVPDYQLALLQKIDTRELYAPLRESLPFLTMAVILFIIIGTLLLQKWVKPIAAQMMLERGRIKTILDTSNDAFIAVGSDGSITDWNPEAEQTLGWTAGEAIGRNLHLCLLPAAGKSSEGAVLKQKLSTGSAPAQDQRFEAVLASRDGRAIPVELSIAPFMDAGGYGVSIFLRDLTASKQAERDLEAARLALSQSQKLEAVGKLTGGVAHDFNNVLQVVKGNLQLLQLENENRVKVQKRTATAMEAVDRGAKLSSQLLAFARRQPLRPHVANLGRTVRDMNDLLARVLGEAIEIETVLAGGLWNCCIDIHQLEQVILNLAINARDAMEGRGRLTIEVGNAMLEDDYVRMEPGLKSGQYVMVAVSDTGCGMPPGVLERAFEPFFTTKPEGKGTGLGLSMAYGFVKQSEGHIRIYSEIGQGTTVKIYLPRSFEQEDHQPVPALLPVHGGNETILVVEDDLSVQATVIDMLSEMGYRILKADNAEMALQVVQSGVHIDVLFTDVVMPGTLRSPELAKRAKQMLPDLRVLFTSGYTQNAIVHGGRLDPGVHLLSKPYSREQLGRKLRELLAASESASAPGNKKATPAAEEKSPALRIALVEDDDNFRRLCSQMMQAAGYSVHGYATAEDAIQAVGENDFDVLITDLTLPGMSGLDLAKQVSALKPRIRIILASGYGDSASDGADGEFETLAKPFTFDRLKNLLEGSKQSS
jgi:PAS domain S-box-containing protein